MTLELLTPLLGPLFLLLFFGLIVVFAFAGRNRPGRNLREIPAFLRLRRAVGLAVEAGTRLHISLGAGGVSGAQGAPALAGLTMLERIARAASISDKPPIATSGEGVVGILSQDTLHNASRAMGNEGQSSRLLGQIAGLTPLSYAAGAMAVIHEENPSANVLVGHFGPEVALINDAAERAHGMVIAGSDHIPSQAVLYAAAQEPLIGEELFAGGAYLGAGAAHTASLRAQDIIRWLLITAILGGAAAKLLGLL